VDDALIVDLFGDWPEAGEGKLQLGEPLRLALEGHSGSVILHIQDAPITKAIHTVVIAALKKTCEDAGIPYTSLSVVSASKRTRDILHLHNCLFVQWWCYSNEEEAIRNTPHIDQAGIWTHIARIPRILSCPLLRAKQLILRQ
jgi:hypothetical protein